MTLLAELFCSGDAFVPPTSTWGANVVHWLASGIESWGPRFRSPLYSERFLGDLRPVIISHPNLYHIWLM